MYIYIVNINMLLKQEIHKIILQKKMHKHCFVTKHQTIEVTF